MCNLEKGQCNLNRTKFPVIASENIKTVYVYFSIKDIILSGFGDLLKTSIATSGFILPLTLRR